MAGITYIVDEQGNQTAAVLPLPEYSALLEELLEDAALGRLVWAIPPDQPPIQNLIEAGYFSTKWQPYS